MKDKPVDFNLTKFAKKKVELPQQLTEDLATARDRTMLEAIAPYARKTEPKNLTPVYIDYKTRKTKLALVLCPEWSPFMPPFNLARLSGVAKTAGYETTIYDLNVRAYRAYKDEWQKNELSFRLWDPSSTWHYTEGTFYEDNIHPLMEPILSEAVDEIISSGVNVVGFTVYNISERATKWMCQALKKKAPGIKIVIGGSCVQQEWFQIQEYYDYVVSGEGEAILLTILDEIEMGLDRGETKYFAQPEDQMINITGLPLPDYESIDFSLYDIPNGVNTEISRGCTAKCTFCEETHFWKYRQRSAVDLITEIEWLYYNKGTSVVWFIDSLVNGNLNELRAFCKAVDAKGLDIKWTGYARCDGRMDLEYFKDLAAGGCIMLNYGIESGSQNVLNDMNKGVTIQEMEDNFRWGKEVGIYAATNWIVGFPTEKFNDFADSLAFIWRNRDMNVNNIAAGVGFAQGPTTIIGQNPHKFNLSYHKYQNHWITEDLTMGGTHVMMRVKMIHMFLDIMTGCTEQPFQYPIRYNLAKEHYKIEFDDPTIRNEVEYDKFDYNIIKKDINSYANTLINEIWVFLRMVWKTRGGYTLELDFNPEIDLKEFGSQYGPGMFTSKIKFKITNDGEWDADFDYKFYQVDNPYDDRDRPPKGRKGPFYAQDYSRMQSRTAKRSRKLAKPEWDMESGRDGVQFTELLAEEKMLNTIIDFSFEYHYKNSGKWDE